MLALLGSAGVAAALVGSVILVVRGIGLAKRGEGDLRGPAKLVLGGAIVAMAAMEIALLADDFNLAYVANHHSSTTPFPFDVATAWAALEGSIILWGLVLAAFTWVVARRPPDRLGAAALAVMGGVGIFFFALMLTVANPFEVCVDAMATGCAAPSPSPMASAPWRWASPARSGSGEAIAPRSSPGPFSPSASSSGDGGHTKSSPGEAIGPGTRWRTPL
jgi:cytochrome c-type biogenesis protein CcmF